ncbi:ABC transporter permease subunit [Georgenia thermotolerans]|uniref:ABC transporter permease subunit n=2 Tax=Georgenia thermotolerans TaxID=527326 RepID=A0A7J5UTT0_9MICO|nr:ABC transporter permease subunit [Georgenia thermotolerans]
MLMIPAALLVGAFFVIPLGRLIVSSLSVDGSVGISNYVGIFGSDNIFAEVLLRTGWIALLVTVATLVLGYPLAYVAVRARNILGLVLVILVMFPFFTSALVRTFAWRALLADNGPINQLILTLGLSTEPVRLVYNDIGVVIGMTQVLLPMMVLPIYARMKTIDRSLVLASRTMGASPLTAWRTVFVPQSMTGVVSGATIVFISALGYYVTPLLLQGPSTPLFAQRIDSLVALPGKQGEVATQSTVVLIVTLVLAYFLRQGLGLSSTADGARSSRRSRKNGGTAVVAVGAAPERSAVTPASSTADADLSSLPSNWVWRIEQRLSFLRFPVAVGIAVVALFVSLAPMVAIVMLGFSNDAFLRFPPSAYSTRWFEAYFSNTRWLDSTWLSLSIAGGAAVIAIVLAAMAAFGIARTKRRGLAVPGYLMMVAPMVIPQVVLAASLLYFFLPLNIAGRPAALVIAYTLIGLPLAMIVLTTAFRNLDPAYERASSSLGARPAMTMRRVIVPLVLPSVLSAFIFVFVTGFGDLVFAQFVGGIGTPTLERQMYRSIREEVSPEVAAVGTLVIGVLVLVCLAVLVGSRGLRRQVRSLAATGRKGSL